MNRGYNSNRQYRCRCQSGIIGWRSRLQFQYKNISDYRRYCELFNIHGRLGYNSVCGSWEENPVIEGSVNPKDLRKVRV